MLATIGVWSLTLLEVKLHSVPASQLVSTDSSKHWISLLKVCLLCSQSLRYMTLIVSCMRL